MSVLHVVSNTKKNKHTKKMKLTHYEKKGVKQNEQVQTQNQR